MARALSIGPKEENEMRAALERAKANPIPWETLKAMIVPQQGLDLVTLENRQPGQENMRPPSQHVDIPFGYRMAISYERQPTGLLAHFSFSIDRPGKLPNPVAVEMLLEVIGFNFNDADRIWQEEFLLNNKPGGLALNVLFMVEPAIDKIAGNA